MQLIRGDYIEGYVVVQKVKEKGEERLRANCYSFRLSRKSAIEAFLSERIRSGMLRLTWAKLQRLGYGVAKADMSVSGY